MKQKQNAVDLTDLAIGILVLGIVVTIGSNILISVRDSTLTDLAEITTTNESVGIAGAGTSDTLANTWVKSVDSCNAAAGGTIPAANYTVAIDAASGVATITNVSIAEASINCTYTTYDTTRADWALPNDAATGIGEYGNWFDIIVIVGVAGLILSLIFLAFRNSGGGDSGQLY